jgi:hypothetical protein
MAKFIKVPVVASDYVGDRVVNVQGLCSFKKTGNKLTEFFFEKGVIQMEFTTSVGANHNIVANAIGVDFFNKVIDVERKTYTEVFENYALPTSLGPVTNIKVAQP